MIHEPGPGLSAEASTGKGDFPVVLIVIELDVVVKVDVEVCKKFRKLGLVFPIKDGRLADLVLFRSMLRSLKFLNDSI